jgi:opacity protein-like surface antigen
MRRWLDSYQAGLRYLYLSPTKVEGKKRELDFSEDYAYSYRIHSQAVMAIFKINFAQWHHIEPFLEVATGMAFNHFGRYQESVITAGVFQAISPNFGSRTLMQLAYSIGAGFNYQFTTHWHAGIGYRFLSLGKVTSNNGEGLYTEQKLSQQLNVSELFLHLTYWF